MSLADTGSKSGRLELFYSSAGHMIFHLMTAFYAVIVIELALAWQSDKVELLGLWWLAVILQGAAALPAGWLADRWNSPGTIVIFFVGIGLSSILCGLANDQMMLFVGLSLIGLFGAIYHPVGIAWVMRTARRQGEALGINGIFGSVGMASAGLVVGFLSDLFNWRAAFIIPGVISVLLGVAMLVQWRARQLGDRPMPVSKDGPPSRADMVKVFFILMVTMMMAGLIYQATQFALPSFFEIKLAPQISAAQSFSGNNFGVQGSTVFWVGVAFSLVYTASGIMQYFAGRLADRFSLKGIYIVSFFGQIAVLAVMSQIAGLPLLAGAMLSALLSVGALPAESMLIGRYTPTKYHGIAFGSKFVLSFGIGFVALKMIGWVKDWTGSLDAIFVILAVAAAAATIAALFLPNARKQDLGLSAGKVQPVAAE
jgi:FSR family fosmidomycin resistance protein-like MFS transporter